MKVRNLLGRKFMKKVLSVFMVLVLMLGLTACGNEEDTKEGESTSQETGEVADNEATDDKAENDEVVTVKFYEHTDNEKIMKDLVEAYNAQSDNIKVELSLIANDDYDDKIKVMLSGNADIDGFWLRGGNATRQLAEQGALLPLDDLNKANDVDLSKYGELAKDYEYDGKNYGLITSKSCWLLWYNKDLFDEAGVDYPIGLTWEEYSDLALELTTEDIWGSVCPDWMMNIGSAATGEYLIDEDLDYTRQYARYLERWYVTDKSHPSIEDMSASFDINGFYADQKSYMMINGDWSFLLLPDFVTDFEYCAAPLPIFDGIEEGSTVGGSSGFSIAANSKHPEEVYDFIKFCCFSDEGATIYAKNSAVPAYPSDDALDSYKNNVTTTGTEYVFSSNVISETSIEPFYNELVDAFKDEIKNALIGNVTLDEGFDNFINRRTEIIK
jgi:multiple sugar transport system substrate-binding protein